MRLLQTLVLFSTRTIPEMLAKAVARGQTNTPSAATQQLFVAYRVRATLQMRQAIQYCSLTAMGSLESPCPRTELGEYSARVKWLELARKEEALECLELRQLSA